MSEDIGNYNNNEISHNKKKTILLVTDNIQHYQQHFNKYNINYYITLVNWNDILTFITNLDNDVNKHKNLELIILDISTTVVVVVEHTKINQIPTTIFREIKKYFLTKEYFLYCHLNP